MKNIINGKHILINENNVKFSFNAKLNINTSEIIDLEKIDNKLFDKIISEYFIDESNNEEYEICNICHSYIKKIVMVDDYTGKGLHEEFHCYNGCDDE